MTYADFIHRSPSIDALKRLLVAQRVWLITVTIIVVLSIVNRPQAWESVTFTLDALLHTAPYLILSVLVAAYAVASGAGNIIAGAFTGSPRKMIVFAAVLGGVSPFCSCGVIPLIAALLAMGVPLSGVMAFWLASPVIDPSMFVLTSGLMGFEFAVAKTVAAIGLGLFGGFATYALTSAGFFADSLRPGVTGGCGGSAVKGNDPVVWRFWVEAGRRITFGKETLATAHFLIKWLALAFVLESLMLAYVPAELVATTLGGDGLQPIFMATIVGVPAYLNGYAALPLVSGMIEQGMAQGAGLAFLVAGGVTSLPAAIAVFALVKRPVFAWYIVLALLGSFASGLLFELWVT